MAKHFILLVDFIFLFLIVLKSYSVAQKNVTSITELKNVVINDTNMMKIKETENELTRKSWKNMEKTLKEMMTNLMKRMMPLMVHGSADADISPECSASLIKVLTALRKLKTWAFKMVDSWGKIPNGILSGTLTSFGDYDECLNVTVNESRTKFVGQFCSINLLPPLPQRRPFYNADHVPPELDNLTDPSLVISEFLKSAQHFYYINFRTSVCLPSLCSQNDVQNIAQLVMKQSGINWGVQVAGCEVKESFVLETHQIVIVCILSVFVVLLLLATTVEVVLLLRSEKGEKSFSEASFHVRLLLSFSAYANTKRLLKKDDSPDSIKIFHGMKVITMLWVILNHSYYYINFHIFGALSNIRNQGKEMAFQFIANGFLNVETFFFITAVLVAYGRMKSKDKRLHIPSYIFRRIWRLSPPYMLVIATTLLIPVMGSGPVWKETVGRLVDKCKANWWTNLLYINNWMNAPDMCLQWTWYLPVDTQLYFLAIIVLIPLKTKPLLGFSMIAIFFSTGIVATVVSTIYFKLTPTAIYVFSHPEDIDYYAEYGYFRTYIHMMTFSIGLIVGYVITKIQKIRIPLYFNIMGWLIFPILAMTVVYGVYDWNQGNIPSLAVSALYTCTSKVVWSLALAWVTLTCITGNGGVISSILSWSAFVPLSRLTYMAYLIHPVIQHMVIGSTRENIFANHRTFVYLYLGHIVAAYAFAYLFSLLFESPFMVLEKVMFSRQKRSRDGQKSEAENPKESYINSNHMESNGLANGLKTNIHL